MKRADWLPIVLGVCVGGVVGVLGLAFGWSWGVVSAVACGGVLVTYAPIAIRNVRREYSKVGSTGGETS